MKTGSLSRRTVLATLGVLVLALGGFATLITLRYRDGLRSRARSQLLTGARKISEMPDDQINRFCSHSPSKASTPRSTPAQLHQPSRRPDRTRRSSPGSSATGGI
jgi:hypothetical protein